MKKIVCTYDDYDKFLEVFQKMNFKALDYAPTKSEMINTIIPNIENYLLFLLWIDETGNTTEDNKEVRDLIRKTLISCLELEEEV